MRFLWSALFYSCEFFLIIIIAVVIDVRGYNKLVKSKDF